MTPPHSPSHLLRFFSHPHPPHPLPSPPSLPSESSPHTPHTPTARLHYLSAAEAVAAAPLPERSAAHFPPQPRTSPTPAGKRGKLNDALSSARSIGVCTPSRHGAVSGHTLTHLHPLAPIGLQTEEGGGSHRRLWGDIWPESPGRLAREQQ